MEPFEKDMVLRHRKSENGKEYCKSRTDEEVLQILNILNNNKTIQIGPVVFTTIWPKVLPKGAK